MTDILLLHGAWHGGWCWRDVLASLAAKPYRIETPSYVGLSERAAELTPAIGIEDHVRQITEQIGDRRGLVVCAHSYGGAVIRMVEARLPTAFKAILYLDGAIPAPGQSILDLNGRAIREERLELARVQGEGWRLPPPDPLTIWPGLDEEQARWLRRHMTDQPLKCFTDSQPVDAGWAACRRVFAYASDREPQPYLATIGLFEDKGWETVALSGGHELMVTRPLAVAEMIDALACDRALAADYG